MYIHLLTLLTLTLTTTYAATIEKRSTYTPFVGPESTTTNSETAIASSFVPLSSVVPGLSAPNDPLPTLSLSGSIESVAATLTGGHSAASAAAASSHSEAVAKSGGSTGTSDAGAAAVTAMAGGVVAAGGLAVVLLGL